MLLHMADSDEPAESDDVEATEAVESEQNEIEAFLNKIKNRHDRENDA